MKKQGALFGGFNVKALNTKQDIAKLVNKIKKPKSTGVAKTKSVEQVLKNVAEYARKVAERLPQFKFELITTIEELNIYLQAIIKNGIVAYDTETTGLNAFTDRVVGISLYTPGMPAVYVPYNHDNYEHNLDIKYFLYKLMELSRSEDITVIMAHAMFDQRMTKKTFDMPYYIRCKWDVLLAHRFLNENEKFNNLKFLWDKYVMKTPDKDIIPDSYKALFGNFTFNIFNPEAIKTYPALDGLMTWQLYDFQFNFLHQDGEKTEQAGLTEAVPTFQTANYLSEAVAQMMDNGIMLDADAIQDLRLLLETQLAEIRLRFDSAVDEIAEEFLTPLMNSNPQVFSKIQRPLNPGSSAQLAILFYDAMKLKQFKKRSTDESVVDRLTKTYPQYSKILSTLMEYRKVNKLLGTYAVGLQKRIEPSTGKIHTRFKPYGARTGRFTSSDPNLQNIPVRAEVGKQIRKMFTPSEGHYLIGSDFSQQEPRLLAFTSGDQAMIDSYLSGKDIYANTASVVYKVPYDHCLESFGKEGKTRRTAMKSVILGIMYSRGANSIAAQLGISSGAAKSIISKFYQGFPTIKTYVEQQKEFCQKNHYVKTVWGRKCRIPEIGLVEYEFSYPPQKNEAGDLVPYTGQHLDNYTKQEIAKDLNRTYGKAKTTARIRFYRSEYGIIIKDNTGKIHAAQRQIVNSIIQGSAADMINESIVMLHFDDEFNKLGGKLLLTVHDEIIAEAPIATAELALQRMEKLMIEASARYVDVPMKCDGEILERWAGINIRGSLTNA